MIFIIFEPSYMQPQLNDIDVSKDNIFSCIINSEGGTVVNKYTISIATVNNQQVYTYTNPSVLPPLYNGDTLNINVPSNSGMVNGNDYVWTAILYESTPTMWVTYGTIQSGTASTTTTLYIRKHFNVSAGMYIRINNQLRRIETFNKDTGVATLSVALTQAPAKGTEYNIYTDFLTSGQAFFKARSKPIVNISNYVTTVSGRTYDFLGTYAQAEGITWKYFNFILYNENDEVVAESGQINTGQIQYSFDGLFNNTKYKIQLVIENQDGAIISTPMQEFLVSYPEPTNTSHLTATQIYEKNAIEVAWSQLYVSKGMVNSIDGSFIPPSECYELISNLPYTDGSVVNIYDNCQISYSPKTSLQSVDIPFASSSYINCKLPLGFEGDIFALKDKTSGDETVLSYKKGVFTLRVNDVFLDQVTVESIVEKWLLIDSGTYNPTTTYVWDNGEDWDNAKILAIRENDITTENWFKISIIGNRLLVKANPIQ